MIEEEVKVSKQKKPERIALKDFHICQPSVYDLVIKTGDNLDGVPEMYIQNLITEGVLK